MSTENVKEIVKEKYGHAALRVTSGDGNSCCGHDRSWLDGSCDPITSNLYDAAQEGEVPDTAIKASHGCGNPTVLAELKPGEVVLDLGSGGGIDVLLSARRVGPTAKAFGQRLCSSEQARDWLLCPRLLLVKMAVSDDQSWWSWTMKKRVLILCTGNSARLSVLNTGL
jgi:hypothetical protein